MLPLLLDCGLLYAEDVPAGVKILVRRQKWDTMFKAHFPRFEISFVKQDNKPTSYFIKRLLPECGIV